MIQRQIVVPADPDRLWRALTDPEEAETWFGGRIDWTPLEEGSPLRFTPARGDGPAREGRIDAVEPGRYLRFRWWPTDAPATESTDVAYVLEPDPVSESATHLTVEEAPVPADARACASVGGWTGADQVQFGASSSDVSAVRSTSDDEVPFGASSSDVPVVRWTGDDEVRFRVWADSHLVVRV